MKKEKKNIMLRQKLRANYHAGYWEIVFMHIKSLDVVLKNMRVY